MTFQFLSDEWMAAAREIRARYADQVPEISTEFRINQVVTDVPFGGGTLTSYLDTTSGKLEMDLGALDDADVTVTTDYFTAHAIFVEADAAVAMQAFMTGRIKVQGDMMKLMAMQTQMPQDTISQQVSAEIKAITVRPDPPPQVSAAGDPETDRQDAAGEVQ